MFRARIVVAAMFAALGVVSPASLPAQTTQSTAPMPSVLAGKKFQPPMKGQVDVEFTSTKPKRDGNKVVTSMTIKNLAVGPVARLMVTETWFGKDNSTVTAGRATIPLIQPGEIQTIVIETPYDERMNGNGYNFTHANGTVKPRRVQKLEAPKTPATAPAAATKK
jgi:hypothetical protein